MSKGRNRTRKLKDGSMIIFITRTNGTTYRCLIDQNDYHNVAPYRWCVQMAGGGLVYAVANFKIGDKKVIQRIHRFISPFAITDHINHNSLDNRKFNLRDGSHGVNQMNCRRKKNNKSGVTGVSKTRAGKWIAQIRINGPNKTLGVFELKRDAVKARREAERWKLAQRFKPAPMVAPADTPETTGKEDEKGKQDLNV
jgi:hypothetical protein